MQKNESAVSLESVTSKYITHIKNSRILRSLQWLWILAIILILVWYIDKNWSEFKAFDWQFNPLWLIAAAFAAALRKLLGGLRWVLIGIYPSVKTDSKEVLGHLKVYFLSNMAIYIPGNIWFIANRLYMSKRQGVSVFKSSLGIGYEIVINLWTGLLVGSFVGIGFLIKDNLALAIIFIIFTVLSLILFSNRIINILLSVTQRILKRPVVKINVPFPWMFRVLVLSISIWILQGMSLVCIINSLLLHPGIDSIYVISSLAISWVVGFCVPWAPSGMGVQEGLLMWFLRHFSVPIPLIAAVSLRLLYIFEDIFWAFVIILFSKLKKI